MGYSTRHVGFHHTPDGVLLETADGLFRVKGYVMEGGAWRCPTDKCGAYCCKTASVFPDATAPCEFLRDDLKCQMQVRGGQGAKPYGCVAYPRSQADVEHMNKNARGDFRCWLEVIPWQPLS